MSLARVETEVPRFHSYILSRFNFPFIQVRSFLGTWKIPAVTQNECLHLCEKGKQII
jgi:hypothetical protein